MISKIFLNCKSGDVKHYGKKDIESIQSLFPDLEVIYLTSGSPVVPGDVVICMSREVVWDFPVTKVETSDHRPVEQAWFLKDSSVFVDEKYEYEGSGWKFGSFEGQYTYYLGIPKKTTTDNLSTFEPGTRVANRNGKVFVVAVEQFKDNSFTYCYLEGEKGLYLIPTDELKEVQFEDGFGGKSFDRVWFEESAEVPLETIKGMSSDVWWVAEPNAEGGIKFDSKKARPTLLLKSMPSAVQEVIDVLELGARKYAPDNWKKVENERYHDAMLRHVLSYLAGETHDPETSKHHLAHAVCNMLFLIEKEKDQ